MTTGRRRSLIGAYATFALFTALAGQFWRNLLGWWGFGAVVLVVVVGAVALHHRRAAGVVVAAHSEVDDRVPRGSRRCRSRGRPIRAPRRSAWP